MKEGVDDVRGVDIRFVVLTIYLLFGMVLLFSYINKVLFPTIKDKSIFHPPLRP